MWFMGVTSSQCGSPPHAWGHCDFECCAELDGRFTPTRVGTLAHTASPYRPAPVHPHTRADIWARNAARFVLIGSPPHAWGHCQTFLIGIRQCRFTPTRVGTFGLWPSQHRRRPVHPHTRGDISAPARCHGHRSGSPPHAWGHSRGLRPPDALDRFTPTRVGTFRAAFCQTAG